jgi:hypothetical protein
MIVRKKLAPAIIRKPLEATLPDTVAAIAFWGAVILAGSRACGVKMEVKQ